MKLSPVGEQIADAGAHSHIVAALRGKPNEAKIANEYKFVSPDINYNGITAGYQLLRRDPPRALIRSIIEAETEPETTEHILVSLLNNTLDRSLSPYSGLSFDAKEPVYCTVGYCSETEGNLLATLQNIGRSFLKIYKDDEGQPIFAKKYPPLGVSSAFSLQNVNMWNVGTPAGTITHLDDHEGSPVPDAANPIVVVTASDEHVKGVYPLRLSRYGLKSPAQDKAFGAYDGNGQLVSDYERTVTLPQIRAMVLGAQALHRSASKEGNGQC